MRVTIVIPTYNEKENISDLIREVFRSVSPDRPRIIVIDDASPDGTGDIVDDLTRTFPTVRCIHRKTKMGLGSAYRHAFRTALDEGADAVIQMDADFSHHPRYIPQLISGLDSADVVIGSRNIHGGGQRGWSLLRWALSRGANTLARWTLGIATHDATAGFRCYWRGVFERISLDTIKSDGYSFQVEMTYLCERAGMRVQEIPIIFENRTRGASKISRGEIWQGMLTLARLGLHRLHRVNRKHGS